MKQSDIAMLVLIVSISLLVSYFLGNSLFGGEEARSTQVPVAEGISVDFPQPDPTIFNTNAINLTEKITIGDTNSDTPFTSGSN